MMQHLDHNNILSAYQHGFRKLHSCETQLLVTVLDDLLFKRDKHICRLIWPFWIFPRPSILYHTDACWGTEHLWHGPILRWIEAFLVDRVQGVVVEGFRSQEDKVLSGVLQGTVLGPLLFLLHINDLLSVVTSQVRLFADDCLLYRPILSDADRVALQRDLDSREKWCDT